MVFVVPLDIIVRQKKQNRCLGTFSKLKIYQNAFAAGYPAGGAYRLVTELGNRLAAGWKGTKAEEKEENEREERIDKMLSYRRETALQGALQFSPKVEDWNWKTIFYGHSTTVI